MSDEKQGLISMLILARVEAGESIDTALDAVLGQGTFDRIVIDTWEAFNA